MREHVKNLPEVKMKLSGIVRAKMGTMNLKLKFSANGREKCVCEKERERGEDDENLKIDFIQLLSLISSR